MGLLQKISKVRNDQILEHARPNTPDGDEVIGWVRIRRAQGSPGAGFLFLTGSSFIVHWVLGKNQTEVVEFPDVRTWGVNSSAEIGPILGIETTGESFFLQIPTMTHASAAQASDFIEAFAMKGPSTETGLVDRHLGTFAYPTEYNVKKRRKSIIGMTKRILITVLGVAVIVIAIAIIPLPGPWSILLTIGGLALLSSEYDWAQDMLVWARKKYELAKEKVSGRKRARRGQE